MNLGDIKLGEISWSQKDKSVYNHEYEALGPMSWEGNEWPFKGTMFSQSVANGEIF